MITFGQGNYLSYLTNADDLKKEPFLSDGYLSLENKDNNKTLVLVDCRNYKHQIHIRVCSNLEKHTAFWNKERGPCILNELSLHIENLKEKFKTHPHYFYSHSLAYVLFDYSIFNGFGEYTVSEILFRLMKQFKVKPFEWAVNALKDDSFFSALMAAPKIFHHEITKYYLNVFNPTTFTKKQLQERNRFRHDCIKVYRRKSVGKSKEKVIAFKLKTVEGYKKIFIAEEFLADISLPKIASNKFSEESWFKIAPASEQWFLLQVTPFTCNKIGFGPSDWHNISEIPKLNQLSSETPNIKKQAFNSITMVESESESESTESNFESEPNKKRKRKRSGRKCKKLRLLREYDTGKFYRVKVFTSLTKKCEEVIEKNLINASNSFEEKESKENESSGKLEEEEDCNDDKVSNWSNYTITTWITDYYSRVNIQGHQTK